MMTAGEETTHYCANCDYDLRLLTVRRCPECGTRFQARDESRGARQEEVALLDAAERATARAVVGLLCATIPSFLVAMIICAIAGLPPYSKHSWPVREQAITLSIASLLYGISVWWLGRRLLRALRLDQYRGVVGAFLVFGVWSIVGSVIVLFFTLMFFSLHSVF